MVLESLVDMPSSVDLAFCFVKNVFGNLRFLFSLVSLIPPFMSFCSCLSALVALELVALRDHQLLALAEIHFPSRLHPSRIPGACDRAGLIGLIL